MAAVQNLRSSSVKMRAPNSELIKVDLPTRAGPIRAIGISGGLLEADLSSSSRVDNRSDNSGGACDRRCRLRIFSTSVRRSKKDLRSGMAGLAQFLSLRLRTDRKSTRLNSSHMS